MELALLKVARRGGCVRHAAAIVMETQATDASELLAVWHAAARTTAVETAVAAGLRRRAARIHLALAATAMSSAIAAAARIRETSFRAAFAVAILEFELRIGWARSWRRRSGRWCWAWRVMVARSVAAVGQAHAFDFGEMVASVDQAARWASGNARRNEEAAGMMEERLFTKDWEKSHLHD